MIFRDASLITYVTTPLENNGLVQVKTRNNLFQIFRGDTNVKG